MLRSETDSTSSPHVLRDCIVNNQTSSANLTDPTEDSREDTSNAFGSTDNLESSVTDEVILCLFYRKTKLGSAAYFTETSELHLMYDMTVFTPDFRLLTMLFRRVKPTQIVTCPSLSDLFLRKAHSLVTGEELLISPTADPPSYSNRFHFIPAKEFRYNNCKRSILELKLGSEPENISNDERHMYIMSQVNLNAENLVSAMGGLLFFLQRNTLHSPILHILTMSLKDTVWVDDETVNALQIFVPLSHPSSFKSFAEGSKEGLSIFSLLNQCYSSSGSKYMRVLLSQPTRDVETLNYRHEVILFCLKPINDQIVKSLADSIVHIKSVMKILTRMTNAQASVAQWKAFYDTIYNAVLVAQVCEVHSKEVKFFQQIADSLCDSIFIMTHSINRIMDFEASATCKRMIVKFGISNELDSLKERHSNLSVVLDQVAHQELQQLPDYVESCSMVYIPEMGYLLAIPYWVPDPTEEQIQSLPELQFKFKTKGVVHYKSARCYELDDLLGDVQLKVIEIESRIVLKLVMYIQQNIAPLVQLTGLIAELDCLLAFAKSARNNNLVCPTLTSKKQISISAGRHLLQELCVDVFVPNDTLSSEEHSLVKILSGPNASGKSVYLKQVALIVYLTLVGSFVPAEKATIGVIDQIHFYIHTAESVTIHLSAFMTDLCQMARSIRHASSNSLVLIDEFGKGTSEVDGLGILAACLRHFINQKHNSPHLFVSTHFHSLSNLLPPSQLVRLQHFDHMVDKGDLVYMYCLKEGAVQTSFALQVSQSLGLSQASVARAGQILNGLRNGAEVTPDNNNKMAEIMANVWTQNPNESFNSTIWQRLPKTVFVGLQTLKLGVNDAVVNFNEGSVGKINVLDRLQITPGKFMVLGLQRLDAARIRKAEKEVKEENKKKRVARRMLKRKREDKEDESYCPGGF